MPWYAFLLAPFALIFRVITGIRNWLFDRQIFRSFKSPIPTLVVGNLSVGGTGKTPMVEFLIRNLGADFKLASLSRGYGRKTKGFLQVSVESTPSEIGDEPLQIFKKFHGQLPVFVGEDRVSALQKIAAISSDYDLVLLDDAFQHRRLQGDYYCLLTPYSAPFTDDFLLPMGRLRESRAGARRADSVIVTKCPEDLSLEQKELVMYRIKPYLQPHTSVFFSKIGYGEPFAMGHQECFSEAVILLSGLADDRPFAAYCARKYRVIDQATFPDHHDYSATEMAQLSRNWEKYRAQIPVILTTEKDAVKLKSLANQGFLGEIPIFVLPIEAQFDPEDQQMLLSGIREKFKKK